MLATSLSILTTILTLAGIVFYCIALWSARSYVRHLAQAITPATADTATPPVTILKPVKGLDPGMYAALASHCVQRYAAPYEILFGLSSLDDESVPLIQKLQAEFPEVAIRVVHCPATLGTNGKVSNLAQMLPHARYDHIVISDSDIFVSPFYLSRILAGFVPGPGGEPVGLVTAPYRGRTHGRMDGRHAIGSSGTIGSKLEALAISTDFFPGVLTARFLEKGIHFGLGSTLATTREALSAIGGLEVLVDYLADDYELGARLSQSGYKVVLAGEVVETAVPAYTFAGYWAHQLRWARSMRDSRKLGYLGLAFTYGLPWALLNVVASGGSLPSWALLSLAFLARSTVALAIGVGVLRDNQVLRDFWLLLLRDCCGLALWAWSYAENTIVWRGERFGLKDGKLVRPA